MLDCSMDKLQELLDRPFQLWCHMLRSSCTEKSTGVDSIPHLLTVSVARHHPSRGNDKQRTPRIYSLHFTRLCLHENEVCIVYWVEICRRHLIPGIKKEKR
jgi:hypothetical protein